MNKQDTADVDLYGILGIPKGAPAVEGKNHYPSCIQNKRSYDFSSKRLQTKSTRNPS